MRLEGKHYKEIGDALGISGEQVRLDLQEVDQSLFEDSKANIDKVKAQQLAKLRHAQVLSLRSYHRSCENRERITTEETEKYGVKTSRLVEGQHGSPTHLANYIKAVEAESKLLGIYEDVSEDKAQQVIITLPDNGRRTYTDDSEGN